MTTKQREKRRIGGNRVLRLSISLSIKNCVSPDLFLLSFDHGFPKRKSKISELKVHRTKRSFLSSLYSFYLALSRLGIRNSKMIFSSYEP
jgi:hypothetical protein